MSFRANPAEPPAPAAGLPPRWWQVDPDTWREQVLRILLRGLLVLAPPVYVLSVMMALREGMPGVVVLDTVALLGVVALYFLKSLSFRLRTGALMGIFYALGVGLLVSVGSISQVYLLGFAVMTTLLLGLRAGMAATALNGVTMLAIGVFGLAGRSMLVNDSESLTAWVVLTFNFLMVNTLLAVSLGAIIVALERAVLAASESRDALARERTGLQESEARYRTLFDSSPQPIWVFDVESLRFLEVNSAAVAHYGYTRSEFLAMTIADIRPPEEIPRLQEAVALSGDVVAHRSGMWQHRRADGSIIQVEIKSHSIEFLGRRARLVLAHDVSDRVRAEAVLQETWARLHGVLDHSPLLICLLDLDGRYILANRSLAAVLGRDLREVEGRLIGDLLPPQQSAEFAGRLAEVRASRAPLTVRDELNIGDDLRAYSTVLFPLFGVDGQVTSVGSIALDISDQVRAQADRERLEAQLVQSQKMEAVGRLAGGVAHDFNNMLSVILGYTEIVSADPTTPESIRSDLEQVSAAARHSAELTRQLLAFARQQTIAPEVLDLNVTVAAMLKMLRRLIGADIELVWSPAEVIWPVNMDPSQIDQVLANLVVNARDAIGAAGTITISTACVEIDEDYSAVHADFAPGEYALLSVADNGHGMDRVTLDRIFDPFFTTKPQGQGTGLGLPMVYGIVRQNHGFIHAYSEPGQGTTFRIYLPRHRGAVDDADTTGPQSTVATGSETILIVEDEPALLALITRVLARLSYVVLAASTPREALRIAAEYPGGIDILVSDVIMPEMNGLELRQRLLEIRPDLKSVFMSGYTSDIIAQNGVLDEGIHFLTKPFTTAEIAAKVRTALTAP
jgi:two-component system cell cycle sensor histidine kinase/response regulator CckA